MKWNRLFGSFVPLKKQNPALGAILSGVGSIGSSLFSQQVQAEENQKNRDWQEMMWNKTNEYNSPKNQRKLLEEAGYNPYLYGNDYQGSGASLPSSPNSSPLPGIQNPMIGAVDTFQKQTALLQNQSQLESNVEMQNAKTMQTISDTLIQAYKEGGQKLYDQTYDALQPIMERMQWSGSSAELLFNEQLKDLQSVRYNTDMDSLNKDLQYELGKEYTAQQIKSNLDETSARIKQILNDVDLSKIRTNAELKKLAAEIVVAGAQAWNLRRQGEMFVADAKTTDSLRDALSRQASAIAGLRENEKYHSDIVKESNSYLYGYMTSDKGKRYKANYFQNATEWTGSDLGFAIDEIFGNYIKITGSASVGYNNSNVNSTSQSYNESHVFK